MSNNQTINELEMLKSDLLAKVHQIDITISTLRAFSSMDYTGNGNGNGKSNESLNKYSDYDKNAVAKNKLAYVLKKENRFLHIRQIAEVLHRLEPAFSEKDWIAKLYPAISELKKAGAIVKFSIGESNVNSFWGSKNWVDANGNPKKEHKYDEAQVKTFGTGEIEI